MKRKLKGYMTLESSIIIPITFFTMVLLLYLTFYLYNHMIVGQSCYISALRGARMLNATDSQVREYTQTQAEELLSRQIYQFQRSCNIKITALDIVVEAGGHIDNKLSNTGLYNRTALEFQKSSKAHRLDPARHIRIVRAAF